MEAIDALFQVFLLIFVVGSGFASWWKKREEKGRQQQQREERLKKRPTLPEPEAEEAVSSDLLSPWLETTASQPPVAQPPPPAPPPLPVGAFASAMGAAELSAEIGGSFADDLSRRLESSAVSSLEAELAGRQLGQFAASGPARLSHKQGWRPSASWREAVILQEVLGSPLALRKEREPGFLA